MIVDANAALEYAAAERERVLRILAAVMGTLVKACPSDEHRRVYSNARAVLAEYGLDPDPGRQSEIEAAYAVWELSRDRG